ncbi:MAG: ABC transporter ATP-binding protein [Candidatus Electrothrix sp. EH2]|nr:ABC transporter ATP-binding protein [Candidatus Electrothrix sp. EH2]
MGFSYGDSPVLKEMCLELGKAEVLGIVGPNGSGKSTLIRCIDRILKPQKGSIHLDQKEMKHMDRMEIAKRLGYVPQNAPRTFPITVFDTVLMGRRPHLGWYSGEKDRKKVVEALKRLDIDHMALRDFNELSGGEQQRVLIARALAQEADVLLLDEPTSNLDIRHQLEVMDIMRALVVEKGLSAIVVIHDLNLASKYTDRVIMMNRGRIFASGDPVSVFTPRNIAHIYGVEALVRNENGALYILPQRPVVT